MPTTPVAYDPEVAELRVAGQRRRLVGAGLGVLMPLVLASVLYLVLRTRGGVSPELRGMIVWFVGFSVGISLLLAIGHALWLWRTTRLRVEPGLAMQLSPLGIELEGARIPWDDIRSIRTGWSRAGDGHTLRIERASGEPVELPLDSLAMRPGTLDSAIRAHSDGRVVLDLSAYGA